MRHLLSLNFKERVEFAKMAIGEVDEEFFKNIKTEDTEIVTRLLRELKKRT